MKGFHCIAQWSRTQQLVALSSAEAELNASVRAGQEGLGIVHFSMEIGTPHGAEVLGDSSAAYGINMRVGSGKAFIHKAAVVTRASDSRTSDV